MRQPLSFALGNLVFGPTLDDAWALYRVATQSYPGLSSAGKHQLMAGLASFAFSIGADFQLLRVSRPWSLDSYRTGVEALADARWAHDPELAAYLDRHESYLRTHSVAQPVVLLCVALGGQSDRAWSQAAGAIGWLKRVSGIDDPRGITSRQLD